MSSKNKSDSGFGFLGLLMTAIFIAVVIGFLEISFFVAGEGMNIKLHLNYHPFKTAEE